MMLASPIITSKPAGFILQIVIYPMASGRSVPKSPRPGQLTKTEFERADPHEFSHPFRSPAHEALSEALGECQGLLLLAFGQAQGFQQAAGVFKPLPTRDPV